MTTLGERLKFVLDQRGIGFNEFDRMLGKRGRYTSRICSGEREPLAKMVAKMAEVLEIDERWLLRGEGQVERPNDKSTLKHVPGWDEALAEAKERWGHLLPERAWTKAGNTTISPRPTQMTARDVYRMARAVIEVR